MQNHEQLLAQLIPLVRELLPQADESLDGDTDLYGLGLDSTSAIGLMLAVETRFGITFPESLFDEATFATPAALARAIAPLTN